MTCRILVALDGSAASEAALHEAERIAVGGAGVHLLHVVPMLPLRVDATFVGVMTCHDQALSYLGELRARFPDVRGLDLIRTGDPADAILQVSLEFNINVIAMGTHARSGPAKRLLGSVAETVVRGAQLPVLLRRPGLPPVRKMLRRILVPLDGSEESLTIVPTVKSLALLTGAEIVFLHVSQRALVPIPRDAADPKQKLLAVARRLEKSDVVFWQTVGDGDAVEEILNHAKTLDADLIAMTTQAGDGMERTIVGSAAMTIVERSDQAVLLQKPVVHSSPPGTWKYQ